MTRYTEEWIAKTDDAAIPVRVKDRVFDRAGHKCECCRTEIRVGMGWECDHITALVNGGEHRESNLQCLCRPCHGLKTKLDVAIKAKGYATRSKMYGHKRSARPMPGSKASGWKKGFDGRVTRREAHND